MAPIKMHMEQLCKKWKNEKMEIHSSCGIYKTRYHKCIYLLLLGKRKLLGFEISYESLLLL